MLKCQRCFIKSYCFQKRTVLVSDAELSSAAFLTDIRWMAYNLRIDSADWLEFLYDLYRDYDGCIVDDKGVEIYLDLEVFEIPSVREWFRDWINNPLPKGKRPRLRTESVERIRVLATLLKAGFPEQAMIWGLRPANDNHRTL